MKIVLAPDSFKGSLTAMDAALSMARGILRVIPDAEIVLLPVADGGEGTVDVLVANCGGEIHRAWVRDPLGKSICAHFGLLSPDTHTAVVEVAAASGLELVPQPMRNPSLASSYGTGQLIVEAVGAGAKRIIVGLGGSATNDGGAGMLQALGVDFVDAHGLIMPPGISGSDLSNISGIDARRTQNFLHGIQLVGASDVTSPLCGAQGASAVYGFQKGASQAMVDMLDVSLKHYAALIRRDLGIDVEEMPGAGAAGGLGAGLLALGGALQSGIDLILDAIKFERYIPHSSYVVTGEGKIDMQTCCGKAIGGLLERCRKFGDVPVVAVGGIVEREASIALKAAGIFCTFQIANEGMDEEEAKANAARLLENTLADLFRQLITK
jgi:glycerate kinase